MQSNTGRYQHQELPISLLKTGKGRMTQARQQGFSEESCRLLKLAIEDFDELLYISSANVRQDSNILNVLTATQLAELHESRGLAHLMYFYRNYQDISYLDSLDAFTKNLLFSCQKSSSISGGSYQSWGSIRSNFQRLIADYERAKEDSASWVSFKVLLDSYNEFIFQQASENNVKDAVKSLALKIKDFQEDIFLFYADFYKYRCYISSTLAKILKDGKRRVRSRKNSNLTKPNTYYLLKSAQSDLHKSISIYETYFTQSTHYKTTKKQLIKELRSLERSIRIRLTPYEVTNFVRGFLSKIVHFFVAWITTIFSFFVALGQVLASITPFLEILNDLLEKLNRTLPSKEDEEDKE